MVWDRASGKEFYVIDPAGNYFNGIGIRLIMNVENTTGYVQTIWLNPLFLKYETKELFFNNGLASIRYYGYFEDKYYTADEAPLYYYTDANAALHDWLISYWNAYPIDYIKIIGPHVFMEFHSLTDAANWLNNHS